MPRDVDPEEHQHQAQRRRRWGVALELREVGALASDYHAMCLRDQRRLPGAPAPVEDAGPQDSSAGVKVAWDTIGSLCNHVSSRGPLQSIVVLFPAAASNSRRLLSHILMAALHQISRWSTLSLQVTCLLSCSSASPLGVLTKGALGR